MSMPLRLSFVVFLCTVFGGPALAAPAPFPKSADIPAKPVSQERLKHYLLERHGFHADSIRQGSNPSEWWIIGNTPMVRNGRLIYMQKRYQVVVTYTDRHGSIRVSLTESPIRVYAITR